MEFGLYTIGERAGRATADAWDDDLFEITTADELGFREVWVREHNGPTGPMPAPDLFICKAAALTKQIRLGPGGRHLPFHHPVQAALEASMCDILSGGRYLFGFDSSGPESTEMRQRGLGDNRERFARMYEAIDLILRCWTSPEPFDFAGQFWHGQGIDIIPRPLQQPHMPVGVTGSGVPGLMELAGQRGFWPLFADYDGPTHVRDTTDVFLQSAARAGRSAARSDVRVSRFIYVADSLEQARQELRESMTQRIEYEKRFLPHHFAEALPVSGKVEEVTFDFLVDVGYYVVGDPERVYTHLKKVYDEVGGFGVLLLRTGADRGTRAGRARSMKLFMEEVAPRLAALQLPASPGGRSG